MADMKTEIKLEGDWLSWCRLCAKDDARRNVKVICSQEGVADGSWDSVLVMAIRKYFEVHMRLEDELSSVLCTECYTLISELIDFAEHVTKVQAIFEVLRRTDPTTPFDVEALRQQYGLGENDWTHIIKPSDYEGELEKNDLKVDVAQEFVDLNASLECESARMHADGMEEVTALEEVAIVGLEEAEKEEHATKDTLIKRPRGRPKGSTNAKRLKLITNRTSDGTKEQSQKSLKGHFQSTADSITLEYSVDSKERSRSSSLNGDLEFPPEDRSSSIATNEALESCDSEESSADEGLTKRSRMTCTDCGKSYKKPACYKKHLKRGCQRVTDRQKVDKNVTCEICNKTLSSASALKLHKEGIHENAKPFICDCCGKPLKTLTALNEHKLVHTEERPFVCTICKAGFKNKARLKIHNQIHEEPNFVCNICGKKLQTRRTWNMHKLVHTEERKMKCDVCGACFKRSKTLKTHLLSHTGLRPYVCNYCGRTFACNANCRAHKIKKHPQEVEQEDGEGVSSRLNVPTLDELRVITQKIPKVLNEAPAELANGVKIVPT
ncbi:zinc finger protein 177 [Scaptodrosophila lebanonensis]|uniref:Zinc finger protein 177 n=1 Tax=Drosophila lebanonensis TaxID=7225 RepID=A0A6J2T3W3_DROLE|nr:zinc finger protein 177 [Scaptodrosophila lebanonensis]